MRLPICSWLLLLEFRRRRLFVPEEWLGIGGTGIPIRLCKSLATLSDRLGGVTPFLFNLEKLWNKCPQISTQILLWHSQRDKFDKNGSPKGVLYLPICMSGSGWPDFGWHSDLCVWFLIWRRVSFSCGWYAWFSQMESEHPHARTNKPDHFIVGCSADITTVDSQQTVSGMQSSFVCWTVGHNTTQDAGSLARYRKSKALMASHKLGHFVRRWGLQMWSNRGRERPGTGLFLPSWCMHCSEPCAKNNIRVTSFRHSTHCSTKLWCFPPHNQQVGVSPNTKQKRIDFTKRDRRSWLFSHLLSNGG